jgi:hypothetical protein
MSEGRAHSRAEIREQMSGNLCRCGAYNIELLPLAFGLGDTIGHREHGGWMMAKATMAADHFDVLGLVNFIVQKVLPRMALAEVTRKDGSLQSSAICCLKKSALASFQSRAIDRDHAVQCVWRAARCQPNSASLVLDVQVHRAVQISGRLAGRRFGDVRFCSVQRHDGMICSDVGHPHPTYRAAGYDEAALSYR